MTDSNLPAIADGENLPDLVDDELQGLEGLGYSEKADDSLIPIVGILQDNSGEVKKKHDKYIDGAEPGNRAHKELRP